MAGASHSKQQMTEKERNHATNKPVWAVENLVMGIAMGGGQHTQIRTKCKHLATILRYFKYIFNRVIDIHNGTWHAF